MAKREDIEKLLAEFIEKIEALSPEKGDNGFIVIVHGDNDVIASPCGVFSQDDLIASAMECVSMADPEAGRGIQETLARYATKPAFGIDPTIVN